MDPLKEKETQLVAELANRVLVATNKGRLEWRPDSDPAVLRADLQNGYVFLTPFLDAKDRVVFAAFNEADEEIGRVEDSHPALRFGLKECYTKLLSRVSPGLARHAANVATISAMFGSLDSLIGDDVQPETVLPEAEAEEEAVEEEEPVAEAEAEEDQIDELHAEDAEYAFQNDMAEQAEEFGTAAREEAGLETEEPLATLPGQRAAPLPAPPPPAAPLRVKKLVKRLKPRPAGPPPAPPPRPQSRVLDGGKS